MSSKSDQLSLRPYQVDAIAAVREARARGVRRMVVCLPTGAGKTVIFSALAADERRDVLVLAHREELLEQARDKLQRAIGQGVKVEIEQGQRRASDEARIVVCSIRSLREERLMALVAERRVGLVIYDECHHAAAEDNTRVLRQLGVFEAGWRGALLGFTATPMRGDGQGLDEIFEEIVYSRSVLEMIADGYLAPMRGFRVSTHAELTGVEPRGQDLDLEALAEAVDIEDRNALVARSIQELARDRRTLVFCVTVAHARNLALALRALGVAAAHVHGEMRRDDRADTLQRLREGRLQAITNVGVLTEGFDDPSISCVAMARPTRSQGLYVQCVGRGTRLFEGKKDCLVLDFVDLSELSLVTLPSLFGMPRDLNLFGEEVGEALGFFKQLSFDYPGFEWEAGEITLGEIKSRAESFDPLTLEVHPEIRAISGHAWTSLGSAGLVLHLERRPGLLSEYLVLDSRRQGKDRYQVYLDQAPKARFSTLEAAVEAVDYEIQRLGPRAASAALDDAPWRLAPPSPAQIAALAALRPPRQARTAGQAVGTLAFGTYARRRRWS